MTWWILTFMTGLAAHHMNRRCPNTDSNAATLLAVVCVFMALGTFGATVACTINDYRFRAAMIQCEQDIVVQQKYLDEIAMTLHESMKAYPLEAKLMEELDPALLLKLPEIKSNQVIAMQIEALVAGQGELRQIKWRQNAYSAKLSVLRRRWIVPNIAL